METSNNSFWKAKKRWGQVLVNKPRDKNTKHIEAFFRFLKKSGQVKMAKSCQKVRFYYIWRYIRFNYRG